MGSHAAGARRRGRNEGSIYKDEAKGRWYGAVSLGYGPACVEHILARADALHCLPEGRDVHRHGALPVPLVARLSRMVTVGQLHMR
jgi:hypothetical protein